MDRRRLDDLVDQVTSKATGRKTAGLPYVGLEHIAPGARSLMGVAPSSASESTNGVFARGDILFGKLRPNLRKAVQVDFEGYCSTDFIILRPKAGVNPRYASHAVASENVFRHAERNSIGTGMPRTSWLAVSQALVWVPPLEEQVRIAEVLDAIDEIIQATERVIAKLRATREGLFTEGVEAAISTGRIRRLGEVVDQSSDSLVQTGPFGSQLHASEYIDEGIPAFMPRDIREGKLDIRRSAKISVDKANELGRHRLRSGDVLLARRGDLSQCAVVAASQAESICGTGCLLVRVPREELEPEWLVAAYRHEFIQRQVQARAIGSTMLNLSATLVRSLLIPFPSQALQRLMLGIQESSRRLEAERANLAKLQQLRAGLSADLLSGRVQTVAV